MEYGTPEQRQKIYLKATKKVFRKKEKFCCDAIVKTIKKKEIVNYQDLNSGNMPEFFLFKPEENEGLLGWWKNEDKNSRVIALLLSAEMCKP